MGKIFQAFLQHKNSFVGCGHKLIRLSFVNEELYFTPFFYSLQIHFSPLHQYTYVSAPNSQKIESRCQSVQDHFMNANLTLN